MSGSTRPEAGREVEANGSTREVSAEHQAVGRAPGSKPPPPPRRGDPFGGSNAGGSVGTPGDPFDEAKAGGETGRPCDYWVYYDVWLTAQDERVCQACGPLDGRWFKVGEGPYPPYHDNCRCERRLIWWECYRSSDGSRGGEGGFNH